MPADTQEFLREQIHFCHLAYMQVRPGSRAAAEAIKDQKMFRDRLARLIRTERKERRSAPERVEFLVRVDADERLAGWIPRLQEVLPGARVGYSHGPFGRTVHFVKHGDQHLRFTQSPAYQTKGAIESPSRGQMLILDALKQVGVVV